ncbi:MAG TPA: selenium-binding protein SBP56-related protein, partial [Rhodothermales bacterium]|nr:selenium-binding protein SBP56-related protein [Rhodothermales bacterium]
TDCPPRGRLSATRARLRGRRLESAQPGVVTCSRISIMVPRTRARLLLLALLLCVARKSDAQTPAGGRYLIAWAADADHKESDFLAVLDADPNSPVYGSILTTLPVGAVGTHPHHTEHRMPADNILFANGFMASKTFTVDFTDPLKPALVAAFDSAGPYTFPHTFERLPNGNVLSTFQTTGQGNAAPGGLVELDNEGRQVRAGSAANAVEDVRPYSLTILPEIDRVVSTSTDMKGEVETRGIQIWRLSDLSLLHTLLLPDGPRGNEGMTPGEPRIAPDGSVLITTFRCGMYRVTGLSSDTPDVKLVHTYPYVSGYECAVPVTIGKYVVQTVPAINGLIAMDVSDPAHPVEANRISFGPGAHPHWIAASDDGLRIVVMGYRALNGRLLMLDFDPDTGRMTLDTRFGDPDSIFPGVSMLRDEWPHGTTRDAIPHGVVFSH